MKEILLTIASIRLKQLARQLKEIGWIYLLLAAPLLSIFILRLLELVQNSELPMVGGAAVLLLLGFHLKRKDIGFLSQIDLPIAYIFAVEYFAAILPLSLLFLLATGRWLDPLLMQMGGLIVAFIPRSHRWRKQLEGSLSLSWPVITAFEWRMGLRRYLPFWILLYILSLFLSGYIVSIPIFMLLFAFNVARFYDPLEGKELLEVIHFREYILKHKLKSQIMLFHGLLLPQYLLFLYWHTQYWYILLVLMIPVQLLLMLSLFYKYANYQPNRVSVQNQMVVSIFAACLFTPLMPILFPGILLYLYRYWRKAQYNLRLYYAEY